jgi:hypothetical protein
VLGHNFTRKQQNLALFWLKIQKTSTTFFGLSFFAARSIVFLVNLAREQTSLATPATDA